MLSINSSRYSNDNISSNECYPSLLHFISNHAGRGRYKKEGDTICVKQVSLILNTEGLTLSSLFFDAI